MLEKGDFLTHTLPKFHNLQVNALFSWARPRCTNTVFKPLHNKALIPIPKKKTKH